MFCQRLSLKAWTQASQAAVLQRNLIHMLACACLEDVLHMHRWRQLTAPIAAARVPYGLALGNHDAEADLMRVEIVSLDMQVCLRFP